MSFRLKTILGIALIELSVMAILITVNQLNFGGTASTQLFERVRSTGALFSTMVADAVISIDLATLDAMIENSLTSDELVYIRVRNATDVVLSANGDPLALEQAFVADIDFQSALTDHRIDLSSPIFIAGQNFGFVEIGVSTLRVEEEMASALRWNMIVAAIGMSLVAVFGYLLGSILTAQLSSLREGARMITSGDLGYQIDVRGRDELADTASCFNTMAITLAEDRAELEQRQAELLAKRDRTNSIVESMKEIAKGAENVDVPDSERFDEIGDMARATVVFRDAMQQVQKARAEQARLIHAFDQLDEQVAIYGEDGGVIFLNAAFRLFNADVIDNLPDVFTRREFLEAGLRHGAYPEAVGREAEWLQGRMDWSEGSKPPSEVARAPERTLLVRATDVEGIGTVISSSDITELKVSQAQLVQASKLATLGEMATGIAHELNQPLGVIRMASNNCIKRIQKGSLDADYLVGKLQRMSEQTERAAQIIDHMRIFGRKADSTDQVFSVAEAAQNACNLMLPQLTGDGVAVQTDLGERDVLISGQQVMFEQIILNLLGNARDAIKSNAEDGQILVSIDSTDVDVVSVLVEDTGGG
ncbi:MAG: HAMP domain-containing protein, partial [Pseudomonadota bacterium]